MIQPNVPVDSVTAMLVYIYTCTPCTLYIVLTFNGRMDFQWYNKQVLFVLVDSIIHSTNCSEHIQRQ